MTDPNTESKPDPLHNPAVWFSALLLVFPLLLAIDMLFVHPSNYDGNLRTQIVTAILAVIMMVGAYWLGTLPNGGQKKPADAPAPPAVPAMPAIAPAPAPGPIPGAQGGFYLPELVVIIAALALLAGCAGLNVSWVATATYNTPATTAATLTPGLVLPAVAASAPASAASGAK